MDNAMTKAFIMWFYALWGDSPLWQESQGLVPERPPLTWALRMLNSWHRENEIPGKKWSWESISPVYRIENLLTWLHKMRKITKQEPNNSIHEDRKIYKLFSQLVVSEEKNDMMESWHERKIWKWLQNTHVTRLGEAQGICMKNRQVIGGVIIQIP